MYVLCCCWHWLYNLAAMCITKEINKKRKKEKPGLVFGLLSMIFGEVCTFQINRNRVLSSQAWGNTVPQAAVLVSHKGILGSAVDSVSNSA